MTDNNRHRNLPLIPCFDVKYQDDEFENLVIKE